QPAMDDGAVCGEHLWLAEVVVGFLLFDLGQGAEDECPGRAGSVVIVETQQTWTENGIGGHLYGELAANLRRADLDALALDPCLHGPAAKGAGGCDRRRLAARRAGGKEGGESGRSGVEEGWQRKEDEDQSQPDAQVSAVTHRSLACASGFVILGLHPI